MEERFYIPIYLDMLATFVFALTGAIGAIQRRYDYIGVIMIALVSGVGGSILRDGVFLQQGPPLAVSDHRYLIAILFACAAGVLITRLRRGIRVTLIVIDAFGLGAYAIIGTQASREVGIPMLGAALIGMLNAVGGGLLRDIMIREEPLVFKPAEYYAGAAIAGAAVFLILETLHVPRPISGSLGIATTFTVRILSVAFGWRTRPLSQMGWMER